MAEIHKSHKHTPLATATVLFLPLFAEQGPNLQKKILGQT